jgi:hypothetical protein
MLLCGQELADAFISESGRRPLVCCEKQGAGVKMPRESRHAPMPLSSCAALGTWPASSCACIGRISEQLALVGEDIPVTLDSITTRANAGSDVPAESILAM